MRLLPALFFVCLIIAVPVTANTYVGAENSTFTKEAMGDSCSDDAYAGLPGGTLIGIVELSGHGDVFIDGKPAELAGSGEYQGHVTYWYQASEGSRNIYITSTGFTNYLATRNVCKGKVTYAYYDREAHVYPGMTRSPGTPLDIAVTTTTVVLSAATAAGQPADYGSLKSALGQSASSENPGSLSVTTEPAGATIYIDGVRQGVSPATIPGLSPGSHTLLLKLDGYDDLSLPIIITAGKSENYSSALMKSRDPGAAAVLVPPTKKSSAPGFAGIAAACVIGALLLLRKTRP
jgi:hypothetical protein